jgi:hypothetical protein
MLVIVCHGMAGQFDLSFEVVRERKQRVSTEPAAGTAQRWKTASTGLYASFIKHILQYLKLYMGMTVGDGWRFQFSGC